MVKDRQKEQGCQTSWFSQESPGFLTFLLVKKSPGTRSWFLKFSPGFSWFLNFLLIPTFSDILNQSNEINEREKRKKRTGVSHYLINATTKTMKSLK